MREIPHAIVGKISKRRVGLDWAIVHRLITQHLDGFGTKLLASGRNIGFAVAIQFPAQPCASILLVFEMTSQLRSKSSKSSFVTGSTFPAVNSTGFTTCNHFTIPLRLCHPHIGYHRLHF
jgi:hypothetical protein